MPTDDIIIILRMHSYHRCGPRESIKNPTLLEYWMLYNYNQVLVSFSKVLYVVQLRALPIHPIHDSVMPRVKENKCLYYVVITHNL